MSEAIYIVGMFVCFVLGLQLGAIGVYLAFVRNKKPVEIPVEKDVKVVTPEEIEQAMKEREELIKSQEAFQRMLAYNADMAYGLEKDDLSTEGS